jgi:CMP/dCMP kinase
MLIAIDGTAASGKGTLAKRLAEKLGIEYLDTGKLYRAVGYKYIKNNELSSVNEALAAEIASSLKTNDINNSELDTEEVGKAASILSALPEVRKGLLDFQRNFASIPEGAVLDGRDIGTVVCPNADFKFFITATLQARAERRFNQLHNQGYSVIYSQILEDLKIRDERDSKRAISPLLPAKDAVVIDTTEMDMDEVFKKVLNIIK